MCIEGWIRYLIPRASILSSSLLPRKMSSHAAVVEVHQYFWCNSVFDV